MIVDFIIDDQQKYFSADYPIPTGIGLSKNHLSIFSDRTIFRNSALTTIGSWSLRTELENVDNMDCYTSVGTNYIVLNPAHLPC